MLYKLTYDEEGSPIISIKTHLSDKGEEGVTWNAIINEIVFRYEQTGEPYRALMWANLTPEEYFKTGGE